MPQPGFHGTDAFGLGDVSLLSIETDGTYHDLDVLKVVGDGATRLEGSVRGTPISTRSSHLGRSPRTAGFSPRGTLGDVSGLSSRRYLRGRVTASPLRSERL